LEASDAAGGPQFDVVISDLGLPDASGLDLARRLRERRAAAVPAIAVSGFGMAADVRDSREAGFAAHLTKPIDIKKLDALIREVVRGASETGGAPASGAEGAEGAGTAVGSTRHE
jgi:DNA-binding response OmpR family regulator